MNVLKNPLLSQQLLEMLQMDEAQAENTCKKKDCCKNYKKDKRCKKCPGRDH